MDQRFGVDTNTAKFSTDVNTLAAGFGVRLEYDSRDEPINSRSGGRLKLNAMTNSSALGSDEAYDSYSISYASYHALGPALVLAWEVQGCRKSGKAPLWDACQVDLRGFSSTDYLGNASASGQIEARWQFHRKWGAVAFAGSGYYRDSFSDIREREAIPSYGFGLRYMVLDSQRINVRLDYGKSVSSDAVYLSVGEAF